MKSLKAAAFFIAILCLRTVASAQIANVETPPSDPSEIPLYDDKMGSAKDEVWTQLGPVKMVRNVTRPTLTPVLPDPAKATGAAIVIAPGGGNIMLALDGEGAKVAKEFADRGIAAFILKYRLNSTPREVPELRTYFAELQQKNLRGEPGLGNPHATEDGIAAVTMIRNNAAKWGIDPKRVGIFGFSSGAEVSRSAALAPNAAGRPDFVALAYGALGQVEVPATAPPMFYAIALDDAIARPLTFPVVESWLRAKRPVELHAYQTGGHGFGLGREGNTTALWMDEFLAWLRMQKFLSVGGK